jgi:hypothetical protein
MSKTNFAALGSDFPRLLVVLADYALARQKRRSLTLLKSCAIFFWKERSPCLLRQPYACAR